MQSQQNNNSYIIYIEKNEKVMEKLTQFCIDNNISSAQVSGIGAVKNIDLGVYDIEKKDYHHKMFKEIHELISFQGNIALKDGKPFVHAHITIGNHDMDVFGGHLFEMEVAAVGEFILHVFDQETHREIDDDIGLATLNLCKI